MDTRVSFPGDKAARGMKPTTRLYLVPSSKNEWLYTSTPPIHLHGVVPSWKDAQGQLTFTFIFMIHTHARARYGYKVPGMILLRGLKEAMRLSRGKDTSLDVST
jgi:hypothetical protein